MNHAIMKDSITKLAPGLALLLLGACGQGGGASSTESTGMTDSTDSTDAGSTDAGSTGDSTDEGESSTDTGSSDVGGNHESDVDLGAAGDFVILAKSGISTVPTSAITGDVGLSPAAATFITGFSLIADAGNAFATSPQVSGRVYASDYAPPTPTNMTTAIGDMQMAFTEAAGRAPDFTELGGGDIGGMSLDAGVYKWGTGLLIPTDVELTGSATDVWVFQIAQNLTISNGAKVSLSGGALAEHVYWQVAGGVELGTTAHCEGIVLTETSITLNTGASVNGRLFAQTAVSLDANAVTAP